MVAGWPPRQQVYKGKGEESVILGQIDAVGEVVETLANTDAEQLILLIVLAEIVIVGGALYILSRLIGAVKSSSDAMIRKVEVDAVQTVRLSEMNANIGHMVQADTKRVELALKTLDEARAIGVQIGVLDKNLEQELLALQTLIRSTEVTHTNRLLSRLDALFKRFDDIEQQAKGNLSRSLEQSAQIVTSMELLKLDVLEQFKSLVDVDDMRKTIMGETVHNAAREPPAVLVDRPVLMDAKNESCAPESAGGTEHG